MKKADEMRKRAAKVDVLEAIYDAIKEKMQWDVMQCTDDYDDDGKRIFVDRCDIDEMSWCGYITYRERKEVYEKVMDTIDKLADKI